MKTKIFSIILLLLLSSCSLFDKKEITNELENWWVVADIKEPDIDTGIGGTELWFSWSWVEENKIVDVNLYDEAIDLKLQQKVWIKSGLVIDKNTLDIITSNCDFLEWKTDYVIEEGEIVTQNREEIQKMIITYLKDNNNLEELKDFKSLMAWQVEWKFALIKDKDFDETKFTDYKELYSYFWHYLMSLENEQEFNSYVDLYINQLKEENKTLDENHILSFITWYFYIKRSCKPFIEDIFISY